jgi:hypothetical protein
LTLNIYKMRIILILVCSLLVINISMAQTAQDNREIMETVNTLFKGMNLGDSAMVHSTFTSSPTIATITKDKEGVPVIFKGELQKFLNAVGTPHEEKWTEPIWDVKIQMDGNMGLVWAKYGFYVGKQFSHCGVDAFQLFKGADNKWRIFHLADTRWKEGCNVPPAIANQFK